DAQASFVGKGLQETHQPRWRCVAVGGNAFVGDGITEDACAGSFTRSAFGTQDIGRNEDNAADAWLRYIFPAGSGFDQLFGGHDLLQRAFDLGVSRQDWQYLRLLLMKDLVVPAAQNV